MISINGQYFDGRQPIGVPAKLDFATLEATLSTGTESLHYIISSLKVSPRIGSAQRFITFPNGAQLACTDNPFLDTLPQESPSEGPVAWLEKRWGIALACIAVICCTLLAAYFFVLPALAENIAERIPMRTEQTLGREALAWMDKNGWFKPTIIDSAKQKNIMDGFAWLTNDLPFKEYYHLEFRASKMLGPNAIALPGGTIVITDDMVKAAEDDDEVLAVLAHEIGHVELRHTMRSVLQNSLVAAGAAAVTSDAASLSAAVAGLPVLFAQTKYSRNFETAADDFAFKLLKQKGYSPLAFASIMERLSQKHEKETGTGRFAYLSTHPLTAERVQRARDAAAKK
jgi:Zn-dependent protease with chaperone function